MKELIKKARFYVCYRCWSIAIICTENGTFPRYAQSSRGVTCCKMWPSKSFLRAEVSNSFRFARPQSARRFRERIPFLVRTPSPSALFRTTTTRFNLANCNGIPSSPQGVRARITFYIINISPALRYAFFSDRFIIQSHEYLLSLLYLVQRYIVSAV